MNNQQAAEAISSKLQLTIPAIALSFVEEKPEGMAEFEGTVPSACTLWRRAEAGAFYAAADKHFNCPVGAMTMGFEMPEQVREQLMSLVQMMGSCGYVSPGEAAKIPSVTKPKSGIVYGPLKELETRPDLVLIWLTPRQAMLFSEVAGTCRWTEAVPTTAFGRPACAALPVAMRDSHPTLSLGCMGMRTFTEIAEDRLLAVLPGDQLDSFIDSLEGTLRANDEMRTFYEGHKSQFAPASN